MENKSKLPIELILIPLVTMATCRFFGAMYPYLKDADPKDPEGLAHGLIVVGIIAFGASFVGYMFGRIINRN